MLPPLPGGCALAAIASAPAEHMNCPTGQNKVTVVERWALVEGGSTVVRYFVHISQATLYSIRGTTVKKINK